VNAQENHPTSSKPHCGRLFHGAISFFSFFSSGKPLKYLSFLDQKRNDETDSGTRTKVRFQ
jgi:hypothetical protein